ncbi:Chalcone isomerase-like protein 2 [Linum perenne]
MGTHANDWMKLEGFLHIWSCCTNKSGFFHAEGTGKENRGRSWNPMKSSSMRWRLPRRRSQYGVQLESSVRDRLAEEDKYEEKEESELERVTEFFQSKYLKKGCVVAFQFSAEEEKLEIR